jgi:hypothetical protein
MRFLALYTPDRKKAGVPVSEAHQAEMGRFINESMRTGVLVATGGLLSSSNGGLIVRSAAGRITVTDGPFAEAKEFVGGFALLEVKSREEVIECTKQFLAIAGDGETELRQIQEP